VRTISATIAAELAEVVFGGAHYTVLFFLGVLLFAFTLATNLLGEFAIAACDGVWEVWRETSESGRRRVVAGHWPGRGPGVADSRRDPGRRCLQRRPAHDADLSHSGAARRDDGWWNLPAIFGTVALVVLMTLAVLPAGVATAIYLSEYANPGSRLTRLGARRGQQPGRRALDVFGLFGLGFFVQFVGAGIDRALYGGQRVFGQPALVWAALTMAVLTLPVVIVATEEALAAVPREFAPGIRGARGQSPANHRSLVLPQALPGILTGAILAISRGGRRGRAHPVHWRGLFPPKLPRSLHDQFMQLGYHVYVLSTQSPDVDATRPILYATVLVLLLLTFALNATAVGGAFAHASAFRRSLLMNGDASTDAAKISLSVRDLMCPTATSVPWGR